MIDAKTLAGYRREAARANPNISKRLLAAMRTLEVFADGHHPYSASHVETAGLVLDISYHTFLDLGMSNQATIEDVTAAERCLLLGGEIMRNAVKTAPHFDTLCDKYRSLESLIPRVKRELK